MHIALASLYHISGYKAGNERYTHELACGLVAAGHRVTYLTAQKISQPQAYPYSLREIPVPYILGKPVPSPHWLQRCFTNVDIYHACGSGLPLISQAYVCQAGAVPTVLTFQAPNNPVSWVMRAGSWLENNLISRSFTAVITTSPQNQTLCSRRWPHLKVLCIPLMVADQFLSSSPGHAPKSPPIKLIFVAHLDRHHYYKGLAVLLNALTMVPEVYRLTVVGAGDELAYYRQLTAFLHLENRVDFMGEAFTELPHLYASHHLFVFPSTSSSEGFGISLVEAMAMGIPTITTSVIGIAEWLKSKNLTTIIPPNDPNALARAITSAYPPIPAQVSRARAFARSLTRHSMVASTIALYNQLKAL